MAYVEKQVSKRSGRLLKVLSIRRAASDFHHNFETYQFFPSKHTGQSKAKIRGSEDEELSSLSIKASHRIRSTGRDMDRSSTPAGLRPLPMSDIQAALQRNLIVVRLQFASPEKDAASTGMTARAPAAPVGPQSIWLAMALVAQ